MAEETTKETDLPEEGQKQPRQEGVEEIQDTPQPEQAEPSPQIKSEVKIDPDREHHENIHDLLMNPEEITWRSIIIDLIKSEQMDPWNIDLSKLSKMFVSTLKKMKEMNLQISGKVLLCAALLLRIKSTRLIGDDLMEFDRLLASGSNDEDIYADEDFVADQLGGVGVKIGKEHMMLVPKTPQPRKRKVSVYDLIDALAVALNTRRRRVLNHINTKTMEIPDKPVDISKLMNNLYKDVVDYLNKNEDAKLAFSSLVPGDSKLDKVHTFIPLLHLTNARKVDLEQQRHFDEIWVTVAKKQEKKQNTENEPEKEVPVASEPEKPAEEASPAA